MLWVAVVRASSEVLTNPAISLHLLLAISIDAVHGNCSRYGEVKDANAKLAFARVVKGQPFHHVLRRCFQTTVALRSFFIELLYMLLSAVLPAWWPSSVESRHDTDTM